MSKSSLYEQDFYAWANQQAALLRAGELAAAETGLPDSIFPAVCPYAFDRLMDEEFWPDHGNE